MKREQSRGYKAGAKNPQEKKHTCEPAKKKAHLVPSPNRQLKPLKIRG